MLTVTDDAATAIRTLAAQNDLPAQTGVRISSTTGESGATALGLSVAEGPLPEDEVIEEADYEVVDEELAKLLGSDDDDDEPRRRGAPLRRDDGGTTRVNGRPAARRRSIPPC